MSACKHGSGLARIRSQRINPFASMPAAKPIASAAGLIQAIKGAREPLLVAYTLMDNASMQSECPDWSSFKKAWKSLEGQLAKIDTYCRYKTGVGQITEDDACDTIPIVLY